MKVEIEITNTRGGKSTVIFYINVKSKLAARLEAIKQARKQFGTKYKFRIVSIQ